MSVGKASRKKKGLIYETLSRGQHEKELEPLQESLSKGTLQKTPSIIKFLPILILALISFTVYFNALSNDFVYDDKFQILENHWITDIKFIPEIFSESFWQFSGGESNYYRPLVHMVYMVNYHLFGLRPGVFHLVNILVHCGVTVLVFLILSKLFKGGGFSGSFRYVSLPLIGAILFATHPVHTEAVTWISGADHTFTFFVLLSFYLYIRHWEGSRSSYILSLVSFLCALLFKESALTLVLILFAYDYAFQRADYRSYAQLKRYIPYFVVVGVYISLRAYALKGLGLASTNADYSGLSTYQSVINIFPLFIKYLGMLILPINLNLYHVFHPITSLFTAKGIVSLIITFVFLGFVFISLRKNKIAFLGLIFVVVPLLPVFYLKGISSTPFAERFLYLPSFGFILLLVVLLEWIELKTKSHYSIIVVFAVITVLYSLGTIARNDVWKDDYTLWSDTIKKSSDSADAHNELGVVYKAKGQLNLAVEQYKTALQLKPDFAKAHNNLANAYADKGQLDLAVEQYKTALQLKPDLVEAHYNLANAYERKGQLDLAIEQYKTTLQLKPDFTEAHYNLGSAYANQGILDRAMAEFQTALQLKPQHAQAHCFLGIVYASKGALDRATAEFQTALQLKPDLVEAHYNLALVYLEKGNSDMAQREAEVVLNIRPDFSAARQLLSDINSRRH